MEKLERSLAKVEEENKALREEVGRFRKNFDVEKANWLDEKEKVGSAPLHITALAQLTLRLQVIRYQKQLQLNYVQMYKRNKTLESEVRLQYQLVAVACAHVLLIAHDVLLHREHIRISGYLVCEASVTCSIPHMGS